MTLIVTTLSDDFVIQVSDRRLTRIDGTLYDNSANKAVCVGCQDAMFCMSYTGIATIDHKQTDEWLTDCLASTNAGSLSFRDIGNILKGELERAFLPVGHRASARALTVVLAGFGPRGVFAGQLSNMEDDAAQKLVEVDDQFHFHFWFPDFSRMNNLAMFVHGAEDTIFQTDRKSISKIQKRGRRVAPEKSVPPLVRLIRRAASDPKHGHLVGKDCMSVILQPNGNFRCRYHPEKASPTQYAPHVIFPGVAFKSIWMSRGPKPCRPGRRP